jgi:hypothetical protein
MFAKVLATVLAVVVLTVGGYAYWQYTDGTSCCETQPTAYHTAPADPGCCEGDSRSSCCMTATAVSLGCCESAAQPEVLAIPPREVN